MPRSRHGGRHELGQNDLHDPRTIRAIVDLVRPTSGPIVEIGAGRGAVTEPLSRLGRPLTAVELDEHRVAALRRTLPTVDVVHADATRWRLPRATRVVVGNLPFHVTTPLLRQLLVAPAWQHAVLLLQWEVARKRAGVGGSTMLTAQVAPWFEARLHARVPASSFRPRPSVDGGLLGLTRRRHPLVGPRDRRAYEAFVRDVFTGRGHGVPEVVGRASDTSRALVQRTCRDLGIRRDALPRDLTPEQWAGLWSVSRSSRSGPGTSDA